MKWIKRGALIIVALAALAALVYGFIPKPIPSELATVQRGDVRATIDEEARTRVRDRFTVFAPIAGDLSRLALKAGDEVQAGQTICVLTASRPPLLDARARKQAEAAVKAAEATLKQATANVSAAQSELDLAGKELLRLQNLLKGKHVSVEQVDIAQTREQGARAALESAQFAREAAQFQLEMAQAALAENGDAPQRIEMRSPVTGRVLQVFRESEGPVAPGAMLLEIGNPGTLEIVAELLSTDAVRVKPGMKVLIERWGGDALTGEVRSIEPFGFTKISALGVEEQRVNVIIDFKTPRETWARLGDGYRVEARVVTNERLNVLYVPEGAVFNTTEGTAVFAVVGGKAELRQVKIGERSGTEAEVLAALNEGDSVIVHPSDEITHGTPVQQR